MKTVLSNIGIGFLVFAIAGCGPKATQEECANACGNFSALQQASQPSALPSVADLQGQIKEQETLKSTALAAIDLELQGKLAELGDKAKEEDKTKLNEEYAAKKTAKEQEITTQVEALNAKIKAAQEAKVKMDQEIDACAQKCVEGGTAKKKAECQGTAASLDDYNKC